MHHTKPTNALSTRFLEFGTNGDITIHSGACTLDINGDTFNASGELAFRWYPSPRVIFSASSRLEGKLKDWVGQPATLKFHGLPYPTKVDIASIRGESPLSINRWLFNGIVRDPVFKGTSLPVKYVLTHVPNFFETYGKPIDSGDSDALSWAGRTILTDGEWTIIIDKVRDFEHIYKTFKLGSSFGVTHVARIERTDGSTFTIEETAELRGDLNMFLSFIRGIWINPVIEIGHDAGDTTLWERWSNSFSDTWKVIPNWADPVIFDKLSAFFGTFRSRMVDPVWGDVLRRAIFWYISANKGEGGADGSIVLGQTAFEMLAWTRMTTEKGLTNSGFERLPASDRLRLLLIDCSIPLEIPSSLTDLIKLATAENWPDGPEALTSIRNKIVHPTPNNLAKYRVFTNEVVLQASILSMWYLELALLRLLGYKYQYSNRTNLTRWRGQTVPVPWNETI